MTKSEVARLLSLVVRFDNRRVDEAGVEAWHLILHRYDFEPCAKAVVRHFAESTEWLMPAHITRLARSMTGPADPGQAVLAALGVCDHGTWCTTCKNIHHDVEACTVLRPNPEAWRRALDSVKRVPENTAAREAR